MELCNYINDSIKTEHNLNIDLCEINLLKKIKKNTIFELFNLCNNFKNNIIRLEYNGKVASFPQRITIYFNCPKCNRESSIKLRTLLKNKELKCKGDCDTYTTEKFIISSKKVHRDKYDYSKTKYIGCEINVIITCNIHGDFKQQPNNHLQGKGCTKCGRLTTVNAKKKNTKYFIEKSKKKHGDTYDYSVSEYNGCDLNIKIRCSIHGIFEMTPSNHYKGAGCPFCARLIIGNKLRKTKEYFIEKSKKKHDDKYDYSKSEYNGKDIPLIIICPYHGEFLQTPHCHYAGHGCIKCSANISKKQLEWLYYISITHNINIKHAKNGGEVKIGQYFVDGFCEDNNTIYEFHGDFWHGNPMIYNILDKNSINPKNNRSYGELYNNTIIRQNKLKNSGYKLVVMWESEWNKIINIIIKIQRKYKNNYINNINNIFLTAIK
tara:strand:+ start:1053 stop:2354 length:1302 start_codon:yes stop_codon:yes gene_type:complete